MTDHYHWHVFMSQDAVCRESGGTTGRRDDTHRLETPDTHILVCQ